VTVAGRGAFVVIEGGDESGKSTQAVLLAERLRAAGREIVETFEPGATRIGKQVRALLLDGDERVAPLTEALLLCADRAQHVTEVVLPALEREAVVISDRYTPSSLAYQGIGRGLGVSTIDRINELATGGLEPDVVVVLDIPDDVAAARRRGAPDRLERESPEFHSAVRDAYRKLALGRGWEIVDGTAAPNAVAQEVWAVVSRVLGS
jgi:dTMP kinase